MSRTRIVAVRTVRVRIRGVDGIALNRAHEGGLVVRGSLMPAVD